MLHLPMVLTGGTTNFSSLFMELGGLLPLLQQNDIFCRAGSLPKGVQLLKQYE